MHRIVLAAAAVLIAVGGCQTTAPKSGATFDGYNPPKADIAFDTTHSDPDRPARAAGRKYRGPIVDTHVHLLRGLENTTVHQVLGQAADTGVERLIALPTPNEGQYKHQSENASARRTLAKLGGGRLCGSTYFTRWMHGAYRNGYTEDELHQRLAKLRADLTTGGCLGIGEIGPLHFVKKSGMSLVTFPLDFPPMLKLAELAQELDVWLDLHAEPVAPDGTSYQAATFGGIAALYRQAPALKLILSHTAMTSPGNVQALLDRYPNLMLNLKIVPPGRGPDWRNLEPIVNQDYGLYEDWAALFERYASRFLIGSDARFGTPQFAGRRYAKTIKALRRLLGSLDPDAADRIAHGNARRIFAR